MPKTKKKQKKRVFFFPESKNLDSWILKLFRGKRIGFLKREEEGLSKGAIFVRKSHRSATVEGGM